VNLQRKDRFLRSLRAIKPEGCLVRLNAITKEAWNTAANTEDKREKI
jgi:hypothetical protein